MTALVNCYPDANMRVTDLPWRFTSWALDFPDNVGLWVDGNGHLLGWAVMQTPFWTIDYALHPQADPVLHREILAWADDRAQKIVDSASGRPVWFVNVFTSQTQRIADLEAAGFASQSDVGENSWTKVLVQRPDGLAVQPTFLPDGFTIRPLAGESEVAGYVSLHQDTFESKSMTAEWRQRTLQVPSYTPNLDLMAIAPDGRLAAFCVCWLNKESTDGVHGQIEPLGVHKDFRKLGLGRSILSEGIRRLQQHGAGSIYVETDNYRDEAFLLYESVGFRVQHDVLVYRKEYVEF